MQSHRKNIFRNRLSGSFVMLDLCSLFTRIIQSEVFMGTGSKEALQKWIKKAFFPLNNTKIKYIHVFIL